MARIMSGKPFRIFLELTEEEYLGLFRMGHKELRSPRNQAIYLIQKGLVESGQLAKEKAAEQSVHPTDGGHAESDSSSKPATISG